MSKSFIKKSILNYLLVLNILSGSAYGIIPQPDHVVVLILENHSYNQIVGSAAAPYINSLISDSKAALFSQSYGVSHPSQPNYLQLFSGSNQGVIDNLVPSVFPFTTPNLGAELLAANKTFIGYSESQPSVGYNGEISGAYVRKHNPWVNWQDSPSNGIPAALNQPFTTFPSNYSLLPTVSFVVPNLVNGMHDGTDPTRITTCDSWIQTNLDGYIQWAKLNNSLLILTFDEDDNFSLNQILTLFIGQKVKSGTYSAQINHYNILRVIEDMYGLPHAGAASTAATIDYCWDTCSQSATISANNPVSFCQGGSVILTASSGVSYLWSNGAITSSITVSTSGNYSVSVTDALSCVSTSAQKAVSVNSFISAGTIFNESMGTVSVNSSIATHETNNGFDNDNLTMTGTAEVRASAPSSGYSGATAAGNFFLTNTVGRYAVISGVNTNGIGNLQLSFGIFKSTTASSGSDLLVQVSSDGTNYSTLTFSSLPTGTGTASWFYRTASGSIPSTPNLYIRFLQNSSTTQYRIDDVSLKYSINSPTISAGGNTAFCQGGSVTLNATYANSYNWSNGMSTQNINVSNSGNYSVLETGTNGCTATSNVISVTVTPNITPALSISSGSGTSICSGINAVFNAFPVNGGSTPIYQWKKNGINTGANSSSYSNSSLLNNDVISCVMTSNSFCTTTPTASSNSITMQVIPTITPTVSIAANTGNTICSGTNVTFTATGINAGTLPIYQWKKNGINVGTNNSNYSVSTLVNGDAISCVMTSNAVCITSNPATSNTLTMNVLLAPAIGSFSPSTSPVGSSILINGTNLSTVTSVSFNGISASFTINNNSQLSAVVPSGNVSGIIIVSNGCGSSSSSSSFTLLPGNPVLNLRLLIEGYYLGNGTMKPILSPGICDSITIEFHQNSFPYNSFSSTRNIINTSGNGTFNLNGSVYGKSLYLVAFNHNSLVTWSSTAILFGMTNNYDFTTSASKAYGNSMKNLGDGNFAFYSGDVTHDGNIDLADINEIKNSCQQFHTGYQKADLNGDKQVESADFSFVENNTIFIINAHP